MAFWQSKPVPLGSINRELLTKYFLDGTSTQICNTVGFHAKACTERSEYIQNRSTEHHQSPQMNRVAYPQSDPSLITKHSQYIQNCLQMVKQLNKYSAVWKA